MVNRQRKRVVVTGLGVVASNGIGKDSFWDANCRGLSGVFPIRSFDAVKFRTRIAAQVSSFCPQDFMQGHLAAKIDRFSQFAIAASKMAQDDSGINFAQEDPCRAGIVLGSGLGGMFFYEKQILTMQEQGHTKTHPASILRAMPSSPAGHVSIEFGLKGPSLTIATACTSGSHAIGQACDLIRLGKADMMFAGGTEAPLVYYTFAGFDAMQVMSINNGDPSGASRPFDKKRDGFVMGEGAAILVIEELEHALKRNAHIYAEIVGYGASCGAYHLVMPVESGEDAARAIGNALLEAGLSPADVDYINAHGTSTQANDLAETMAIKTVFGKAAKGVPISSTKSMIGHALGAAGAIEAAVSCLAIERKVIPPTINLKDQDPLCDLDHVLNEARSCQVRTVLSNSFAFGGNNVALIFKEVAA